MTATTDRPTTDDRLILNPALRVIRSTDDTVIVRHGSRGRTSERLSDDTSRQVLADLVTSFAEGSTKADASARFPVEGIDALVDELRERGVLIPGAQATYGFFTAGLSPAGAGLSAATIDVVGTGVIADLVSQMLRDSGDGVLTIRSAATPAALDDPDVIVAVADQPRLDLFFDVNEYALSTGTSWHAAFADGPELIVGPYYRPGLTGCFHDFDVMDEAGRSMRVDHVFAKMADAAASTEPRSGLPLFAASIAAGYVAASVLQDLAGAGSYLEGFSLRIDLDRMQIIRQQLSRLARCPACAGQRPDLRHPFL